MAGPGPAKTILERPPTVPAPHPPTLRAGPSLSPQAGRGAEAALAAPSPRGHGERVGVRGRHGRINLTEVGLQFDAFLRNLIPSPQIA
jgi:hypothetical protein